MSIRAVILRSRLHAVQRTIPPPSPCHSTILARSLTRNLKSLRSRSRSRIARYKLTRIQGKPLRFLRERIRAAQSPACTRTTVRPPGFSDRPQAVWESTMQILVAEHHGIPCLQHNPALPRWSNQDKWRARQESNPQPLGPKPSALSIELRARTNWIRSIGASDGIRTRDLLCHRQAPWTPWLRSPRQTSRETLKMPRQTSL